ALPRLQLLESSHPEADVGRLRGDLMSQAGRYAEAAEAYAKGLAVHPDDDRIAVNLYLARTRAGDGASALADLAVWVKAHPDSYAAHYAYATALIGAGRDDEALAAHQA